MEQNSPSANFEANISSNNAVEFRGFGAGGQARNFFPWSVTSDSYNVERLDFSRGPNSILFGTGTPGGIINVTPKRANLERNRGSLGLRLVGGLPRDLRLQLRRQEGRAGSPDQRRLG
jgi:outer membrane receptor protein involved in Fe transport